MTAQLAPLVMPTTGAPAKAHGDDEASTMMSTVATANGFAQALTSVTPCTAVIVPSVGAEEESEKVPLTPASLPPVLVAVSVTAAPVFVSVTLWPESTPDANAPDVAGLTVPPAPSPVSVKSTVLPTPLKLVTVLLLKSCAVIVTGKATHED